MREIDIIAKEKFNGNVNQALEYLILNLKKGEFTKYVKTLTSKEAKYALQIIKRETVKAAGSPERFNAALEEEKILAELDLSYDEVKNSVKNPYKAKIFKSVLNMLIMDGGVAALTLLGVNPAFLGFAASIGTTLLAMTVATNIMDYVKYKKVKKSIDNNYSAEMLDQVSRGRGI